MDTLRQVSSQEVGHDEFSTQTLARKQREVEEEIQSHRPLIDSLHEQAQTLPQSFINSPQVCNRAIVLYCIRSVFFFLLNLLLMLSVGGRSLTCNRAAL